MPIPLYVFAGIVLALCLLGIGIGMCVLLSH
jgi:hypothetical protein